MVASPERISPTLDGEHISCNVNVLEQGEDVHLAESAALLALAIDDARRHEPLALTPAAWQGGC
jgi:hypothetical protein